MAPTKLELSLQRLVRDWQVAASRVSIARADTNISTPEQFQTAQLNAVTALVVKVERLEEKIRTYEALLSN